MLVVWFHPLVTHSLQAEEAQEQAEVLEYKSVFSPAPNLSPKSPPLHEYVRLSLTCGSLFYLSVTQHNSISTQLETPMTWTSLEESLE